MECAICEKYIEGKIKQHGMFVCIPCAEVLQAIDVCPVCHKIVLIRTAIAVKQNQEWDFFHKECYLNLHRFRN